MAAEWLRSSAADRVLMSLGTLSVAFRCLHAGAGDGGFPVLSLISYFIVEVKTGEPLAGGLGAGRAGGFMVDEISTVVIGSGKVGVKVQGLVSVRGLFRGNITLDKDSLRCLFHGTWSIENLNHQIAF